MLLNIIIDVAIIIIGVGTILYFLYKKAMKINSRGYKNSHNKGIEE